MITKNLLRKKLWLSAIVGVSTSMVLVISFSRCSPLSPSASKAAPHTSAVNDTQVPVSDSASFSVKTQVLDAASLATELKKEGSVEQLLILSDDSANSDLRRNFHEFRMTGKTTVSIEGVNSLEANVLFEVDSDQNSILEDQLYRFVISLKPIEGSASAWSLSVGPDAPTETIQSVLKKLKSITITFKSPELGAPEASPSPSPTDSPTPAPSQSSTAPSSRH
jgi:hypothetical protein